MELVLHYLRLDPNGMPVVARVDCFLPLALVVETGAIALVLLPFALWASRRPGRGVYRAALMVGCAYMVYATLDIEVYRYLRQQPKLP